jgi:hypothetical protein
MDGPSRRKTEHIKALPCSDDLVDGAMPSSPGHLITESASMWQTPTLDAKLSS